MQFVMLITRCEGRAALYTHMHLLTHNAAFRLCALNIFLYRYTRAQKKNVGILISSEFYLLPRYGIYVYLI